MESRFGRTMRLNPGVIGLDEFRRDLQRLIEGAPLNADVEVKTHTYPAEPPHSFSPSTEVYLHLSWTPAE
jgi:hypothetical protein